MYTSHFDDNELRRRLTVPFEEVVKRVCNKDHEAFEILYEHYRRPLGGRLRALVNDTEVAYDLYQDTFIRVWEKSSEKIIHYFEPWLYGIARNLAIDYLRRKKLIEFQSLVEFDLYMWLPDWHTDSYKDRLCDEFLYLQEAVELMTPKYRACLMLSKYWGYTHREIALALGISEKTVSSNVKHAYKQLEKHTLTFRTAIQGAQEAYSKAANRVASPSAVAVLKAPSSDKPQIKRPDALVYANIPWPQESRHFPGWLFDPGFPEGLPQRLQQHLQKDHNSE